MKRPRQPPPLTGLDFISSFDTLRSSYRALPYYHWDELRHREPPPGLDHTTWWKQLKAIRKLGYVDLPLLDASGAPFRFAMPNELQRRTHELDRIMSGAIRPPAQIAGVMRDRYLLASLREEAITSSQLEGAATTREVAIEMLRSERAPRTQGERMIANNYAAMTWIRSQVANPLTPGAVLELQRILTDGAIDVADGSGRLRRADERITVQSDGEVVHVPPPAAELGARLASMCDFANSPPQPGAFLHPVLKAIALHFWLAYDHPFVDGNGRTARALFYWSMLRQGYWLTEFVTISKVIKEAPAQYARAFLFVETDDNDLTYFFFNQVEVLERSVQALLAYLERKHAETAVVSDPHLNERQLALVSHAIRKPSTAYTIAGHQQRHGIVYDTARLDLLDLVKRRYLVQRKRGREFLFTAGPKLKNVIQR